MATGGGGAEGDPGGADGALCGGVYGAICGGARDAGDGGGDGWSSGFSPGHEPSPLASVTPSPPRISGLESAASGISIEGEDHQSHSIVHDE